MSKISKYGIIIGIMSVILLSAINIQNFNLSLTYPIFATTQNQTEGPISESSTPESLSNEETNVVRGLIIGNPPFNGNCGINPQAPPCCVEPTTDPSCVQSKKVDISNFETIPQPVHVGDQFRIQVTVTNNLDIPTKYVGEACGGSPLDVKFDKNVNVQNINTCLAISFTTLDPNEKATVQGSGGIVLVAENTGTTNAKVTFSYNIEDKQESITKSFSFEILP
jgi:hypothetical protein